MRSYQGDFGQNLHNQGNSCHFHSFYTFLGNFEISFKISKLEHSPTQKILATPLKTFILLILQSEELT